MGSRLPALTPDPSVPQWIRAGLTAAAYLIAGTALFCLGAWDIYADAIAQGDPLWTTLLENAVTLAVGVSVFGAGVWVTGHREALALTALARWTLIAVGFLVGVTLLILGTQVLQTHWKPWMMYANFSGALLLGGFATGLYASWLQRKAYFDELTGLPNRSLMIERMQAAIHRGGPERPPFGLLYIDLDNFKDVNEGFGQEVGDHLLKIITRRLEEVVAAQDTVAHLGGDELAVLVPRISDDDTLSSTAEALQRALQEPVHMEMQMVQIQASFGIALYPRDAAEPAGLLRCSDAALRHSKRSGGNQWAFYRPELIQEAANRVVVGGRLRKAIDEGEIRTAFQPVVRLSDEAVIGYEALARWYHPQEGWIPPDRFIPVAEQNGLIEEVSQVILRSACAVIARSEASVGDATFVSVNISPLQIHRSMFLDTLTAICDDAGASRHHLVIELTEQAMLALDSATLARLEEVRSAGIEVAIDDFGTGYASLTYLKHLPADRLKLDRSFITDLDQDRSNQAIVGVTRTLADAFGLSQIAEGIETRAEADELRALGYTCGQGYLFGRPRVETPS